MTVVSRLLESIVDTPGEFADVAAQGPIEGLLLLMGALFVLGSSAVFGVLVAGAVLELLMPDSSGATHPEGR